MTPKQPMRSQLAGGGGVIHEGQVTGANLAKHSASAAQRLADKERLKGLQLQKQVPWPTGDGLSSLPPLFSVFRFLYFEAL